MKIFQVDAFAEKPFQGNPAAVVPLNAWLPEKMMQQIAMENNLAETAFIIQEGDSYLIRWFTPTVEVDLCGHATLASGHVVFEHLGFTGEEILFQSMKSGMLKVMKGKEGRYVLDFPAAKPVPCDSIGEIFLGLKIAPRQLYQGPWDYLVELETQQQVEALKPDFRILAQSPGRGVVVTAKGDHADFVSRCFYPQSGIEEDPATGSAHTMLIPYWSEKLGKTTFEAIQLSQRVGQLSCGLIGDRVLIGGKTYTYLVGEIFI
jgi:PhzF family phenazine biosynthesis protein